LEKMKGVSEDAYHGAIDMVGEKYGRMKDIGPAEAMIFANELKAHWKHIKKGMASPKKTAKKAVKKVAKTAKKAVKKAGKKKTKYYDKKTRQWRFFVISRPVPATGTATDTFACLRMAVQVSPSFFHQEVPSA